MNPVECHFFKQVEPYQSIMLYIRSIIKKTLPQIEEKYRYKVPFYYHHKKPLLYLNVLKGTNYVDVAFMQGVMLEKKYTILKYDNNRKTVRSLQVKSLENFDELAFVSLSIYAAELRDNTKRLKEY